MAEAGSDGRWVTDGRFFRSGSERVFAMTVTYGPFPGGWSTELDGDFARIREAGFNSIRLYEMPEVGLLDAAERNGLKVFGGLGWAQNADFFRNPGLVSGARVALVESLRRIRFHPALAGVYVGNEIPTDLVRWMGPERVLEVIEDLIRLGKRYAPEVLFAYANYPSTEYLEPANADFSGFNVYLEREDEFRAYVRRLHHVVGDRPLVISEFGMDSLRNGVERQAEVLAWGARVACEEETAGFTVYAWSDRWWNAGAEVRDWDFGLVDRGGEAKPALGSVAGVGREVSSEAGPFFSVVVCTRDGRWRIGACLEAIKALEGAVWETIVVDDGSGDGTAEFVRRRFPWVRVLEVEAVGLSAARNAGAAVAKGEVIAFTDDDCEPDREWLMRLARVYREGSFAAVGGPNLPPSPRDRMEAVVCAAPGAPSHVMLDDVEAEHLPGCNLSVTRAAFDAVGGFDPQFETAGDDVDFCWRLRDAGYRLGFAAGAFVWHWRRSTIRAFLRQQAGYGVAERLLIAKFPERFSHAGEAKWLGFVYGGGPVRVGSGSIIYHGPMGVAGYQSLVNRMLPLRGLHPAFDDVFARMVLAFLRVIAPVVRSWKRKGRLPRLGATEDKEEMRDAAVESVWEGPRELHLERLLAEGWVPGGATDGWDLVKDGRRLLLATEHGVDFSRHTLVREWEDA